VPAPPAPAGSVPVAISGTFAYFQASNSIVRARFANVVPASRTSGGFAGGAGTRLKAAQARPQPLYATFDVQQEGQSIRIVDFDGSVYNGKVLLGEPTTVSRTMKETKQLSDQQGVINQKTKISFTASGTNRTLRKAILIDGAITAGAKPQTKAEASAGRKSSLPRSYATGGGSEKLPSALSNEALAETDEFVLGDLEAVIHVDRTNETRVQATRVSQ
jgi:hypothetical protein